MRTSLRAYSLDKAPFSVSTRVDYSGGATREDLDLVLLNRMASRMSAAAPLRDVLHDVVEFVANVVKCDSCIVYVLEGEDLGLRASNGCSVSGQFEFATMNAVA